MFRLCFANPGDDDVFSCLRFLFRITTSFLLSYGCRVVVDKERQCYIQLVVGGLTNFLMWWTWSRNGVLMNKGVRL